MPAPSSPGQPQAGDTAKVRLTIPNGAPASSSRRRNFVSPAASGATIAAGPHGGTLTTTAFDISTGSALCPTGGSVRTCTLTVTVPVGSDDFDVTIYDTAPGTNGVIPMTAHVLGMASVTQTIASGGTGTVPLFVQGVIAGFGTLMPLITFPGDGGHYTQTMMFNPADFANKPITTGTNDPYNNPITVTVTETGGSGFMHLTVGGADVGTSTVLTQSSQTLGVFYLSGGTPGYYATVTLTANGVKPVSFNVAPMYVTSTSPYYSNGVLAFTGASESAVLNISEAVGSNTYGLLATACASGYTMSTVTGSGATGSFTVTSGSSVVAGGCSISVTDSGNTAFGLAYTQNGTSGGLQIGGITEYPTPITRPNLIVSGADGNLYVAGSLPGDPSIWVYTTGDGEAGWYNALVPSQLPESEAAGPDGNVWYVGGGSQAFHNTNGNITTSGCCTTASPTGAAKLNAIAAGPDGNMWMTDGTTNDVYAVTTAGLTAATYSLGLTPSLIASSKIDNAAWIVSPSAGASTLIRIAPGGSPIDASIPNANVGPAAITTDAAGNVWIAEQTENQIDEYTPGTSTWTQHPIGASDGPAGIAVDPSGNIWFTAPTSNTIGELNVSTGHFVHYAIPTPSSLPGAITLGADGKIWFTESASPGQIGVITP